MEDFAASFVLADETIVPDIYFVRDSEAERQRVTAADLVERVRANGQCAVHLSSFGQIVQYLKESARARRPDRHHGSRKHLGNREGFDGRVTFASDNFPLPLYPGGGRLPADLSAGALGWGWRTCRMCHAPGLKDRLLLC